MADTVAVQGAEEPEYDKVTQASLNGIYVKAAELDRGHNDFDAPAAQPPGMAADAQTHASTHASDAETHASARASEVQAESDGGDALVDAQTHVSTHAAD